MKEFYSQMDFFTHAILLDQAFAHCPIFPTAAPKGDGPYLSPIVADHPLRPAKDHWLGRLLPYQLPNPAQAHLIAINLFLLGIIMMTLTLKERGIFSYLYLDTI
jgi:hypothetical protein